MFLELKRMDKKVQGLVTINTNYIINVRPFSSSNSGGVSNGTQINFTNGETLTFEESYEDVVAVLETVTLGA